MCGVPTVSFNFGESVHEEIFNNKSGFVIEDDKDFKSYEEKLDYLMNHDDLLKKFSIESKKFSKKFLKESIIKEWINLFEQVDKNMKH